MNIIKNIENFKKDENYLIFSGIGNHKTFLSMIKNYGLKVLKDLEFPDHYEYKSFDINKILYEAKKLNCKIITTEKDFLRLDKQQKKDIKYLSIELKIKSIDKFKKKLLKI